MMSDLWPSSFELLAAFTDEIRDVGGSVKDTFNNPEVNLVLARAILPKPREVSPGDRLQGGVAIRAMEDALHVHPYVFRQVCSNGAIMAHSVETRVIRRGDAFDPLPDMRQAIRECCADDAFANATAQIQSLQRTEVDWLLTILPAMARLPKESAFEYVRQIMSHLENTRDNSAFALMQAVTATARDTHDPDVRWRLEELGGGIPTLSCHSPKFPPRRALVLQETEQGVLV